MEFSLQEIPDEKAEDITSDDKEIWEAEEEPVNQNDDAEVWESDEGVSPEDNAEVWEDEKDYADDDDAQSQSFTQKVKSLFKHDDSGEEGSSKSSFFSSFKFDKGLGENSDMNGEFEENMKEPAEDDKVDLGSDDDYIYVDHSNDESSEDMDEPEKPDLEDYLSSEEFDYHEGEEPIAEDNAPDDVVKEKNIKKPVFSDKINIKSDDRLNDEFNFVNADDYIEDETPDSSSAYVDKDAANSIKKEHVKDSADSDSVDVGNTINDKDIYEDADGTEKVDLGSDDDYIYVDHSNDEVADETETTDDTPKYDDIPQKEIKVQTKSRKSNFVKNIISEVVNGESRLQAEEIETVRGEIMDDDETPLYRPAPDDENVVEAEIVNGNFHEENLERPTPKEDYFEEDEELNIFTDELPDLSHEEYEEIHDQAADIIDKAMSEFMNDVFDKENPDVKEDGLFEQSIRDRFVDEEIVDDLTVEEEPVKGFEESDSTDIHEEFSEDETIHEVQEDIEAADIPAEDNSVDDVVYFKGATDVTNPLRKNNVYYKDHKSRSIKDSIKGIKKDMQYINKSLNEIENPTQIDYVSVVDRTEEYNPDDYLSRPSDDDSDRIIQMEEESRFGERKDPAIENEIITDSYEDRIADDDVIVTVNEQFRNDELKDQALEDIIQTANDDYRQIEKERFQSENKLKAFDDKKLPGKRKMEDEIIDYVQASDIGLTPQNDLYALPIPAVAKSVKAIVDIEGPVHVNEVTKRIKDSCNIKRAGSKLKNTVKLAVDEAENSGDIIKIGNFLYDASNNDVVIRRRNKPNIELISDEEIAKSIELVLIHKDNVTTKQIAKEASRNFGFRSTSKKTSSRINSVLDLMIANNRVKIVNDYVELN